MNNAISAFRENFRTTLRDAQKMKERMLKKGLRQAKAKCPVCEGYLHMTINGPKNHAHMNCTGSCKRMMME